MKIDLRTIPDAEVSGIDLMDVDITLPAPDCLYHNIRMSDECPRF